MRSEETRLKFERLAFDANAAIDFLRPDRPTPQPLLLARELILPCFAWAELEVGLSRAPHRIEIEDQLHALVDRSTIVYPDEGTIQVYVNVRYLSRGLSVSPNSERREGLLHDLWIASLCLQHELPLLTNDRDFDRIEGLTVLHW